MKTLHWLVIILLIAGGLNWGLYAFNFNLVHFIFGYMPALEKLVYILVGLAAVYKLVKICTCGKCSSCGSCGTGSEKK